MPKPAMKDEENVSYVVEADGGQKNKAFQEEKL